MKPIDIASRVEMFVDDFLIERMAGLSLRMHEPTRREIVMEMNQAAEGTASGYFNFFHDGQRIRMYYRGFMPLDEKGHTGDSSELQTANLSYSDDGIHFTRPKLGLYDFKGSRDNNIVLVGEPAHNFYAFKDENPSAKPDELYKGVGGGWEKLYGFVSPDGVRWRKLRNEPLAIKGKFDSLNIVYWDKSAKRYRSFSRYFELIGDPAKPTWHRAIQSAWSDDFINWDEPTPHEYSPAVPFDQFYTNATVPCPGAEHILLSFPKRFVPDRKKVLTHMYEGVSDAVFMSSRDGMHWDRRFSQAWLRPGTDPFNWIERNNMPARGIVQTAPDEFSMYISEHTRQASNRLRRVTIRKHGFASVHAERFSAGSYVDLQGIGTGDLKAATPEAWAATGPAHGGEFVTKVITFTGKKLLLNYSTSAVGFLRVEIQTPQGMAIPGKSLREFPPLYGDELDAPATWTTGDDLSALAGKPVRLRFVMSDADLYAMRTGVR